MLTKFTVEDFKTIERQEVELGRVNFFIGANGSGKSNLLEALGVLSAAADGRVDDGRLLERGVRPGVPRLYKSNFPLTAGRKSGPSHIYFSAHSDLHASYEVTLNNPLQDPSPAWRYKTEVWREGNRKIVGRSPRSSKDTTTNTQQGLAALKMAEQNENSAATQLLNSLQRYVIYSPATGVLRGVTPETQPKSPIGLSGGALPDAISTLLRARADEAYIKHVTSEALLLVDWAKGYGSAPASSMLLSPAAMATPRVVRFYDRYMRPGRNVISGYDASEGALFILFAAVLAAHKDTPSVFAVDNLDHGLNPRLARALVQQFCSWMLDSPFQKQALITTHNPLVLDGIPLGDDRVRLFTVSRTRSGRSSIRRIELSDALAEKARGGWTLSRMWVDGTIGGVPNV